MDKLSLELEQARAELAPRWDEERSARLFAGTLQRKRRRAVQKAAGVSIFALGTVSALALVMDSGVPATGTARLAARDRGAEEAPRAGHTLRLADGSSASLVGERSELEVSHNTTARIGLRLLSGRAHFDVVPNSQRSFVVEVDPYRVEVIGTVFDLTRDAKQLQVQVSRGKVRVYGPHGARDVAAGQQQNFEIGEAAALEAARRPGEAEPADAVLEADANDSAQPARVRPRNRRGAVAGSRPSWRSLSQSGQYEAAFEWLRKGEAVEDDAAALMDAADAARLSGHPESAVQYLERVVSSHGQSPVAPLAAFTLGRVYLDKLGQPDRAAHAFEFARKLAPAGSLAQDALAREVEALSKGGNAQKAYVRAQEYLEHYPNGRRVRAVQLYGGME